MKAAKDKREGNRRLLELAKILDAADAHHKRCDDPAYDQTQVLHDCGTPACAFGHWAINNPSKYMLKAKWNFDRSARGDVDLYLASNCQTFSFEAEARRDFKLSMEEADELFGSDGCNKARNGKAAAAYIRAFVRRRRREARK